MKRKVKRKSFIVGASYVLLFACLFLCVCLVALNKKDGIDAYDQFVETAINSSQSEQSIVIENTTFHGADTFVCVNSGENVTIQNCSFENTSESAIVVNGGTLSIEDCSISDCAATNGGAISIASGTLNIKNTEISDNSASKGGAIFARGQDIEINIDENCVIANNSATSGGAIYLEDTSDGNTNIINLLSATFDGNNATSGFFCFAEENSGKVKIEYKGITWLNAGTDKLSVAVECGEGTILERIILPDGFLPYVGETAGTAIEIGDTYESTNFPLSDEECCGWFVDAEYSEVLDFGDIEIETDELIVEPEPLKIYTAEASDTSNFIFALNSDGTSYNVKASGTSISGTIVLPAKYDNGTNGLLPVTSTYAATSSSTGAFFNCKSMTKLVVNSNMTSIGNYAFQYCSKLTTINIPDSVTSIGSSAFLSCSGLTEINISTSVESIGKQAFYSCSGLTEINIPDSVTSIGSSAFHYCTGLTSITVSSENTVYDSRENCNAIIETASNTLIQGCKNSSIPASVTSIGDSAFRYCSKLTTINIPDSVTSIGSSAFHYCTGLTGVTIGSGVTSIGDDAFEYCTSLTSITVSSENTVYDSRENCNAIIETASNTLIQGCKNTIIPASVTSIGDSAFYRCTSLTDINIPYGVTNIGESAFEYCTGLTSVNIPDSVTSIGNGAFFYCTSLTDINIPDSVTSIGSQAFYSCSGLTEINITNGVTNIGESAFEYCTGLTHIFVPSTVTTISASGYYNSPFYGCSSSLVIYTDVANASSKPSRWGTYWYYYGSNKTLTVKYGYSRENYEIEVGLREPGPSVTLVPYIDGEPQSAIDCIIGTAYDDIAFPLTDEQCVGWFLDPEYTQVFDPTALTEEDVGTTINIYTAEADTTYLSFESDGNGGYAVSANGGPTGEIFIPAKYNGSAGLLPVTSIGVEAFRNRTGLTGINIPNSVTSIGSSAFYYCTSLTDINIPDSVTSIGSQAFYFCSGLTTVTLGNSVSSIESSTFTHCSNLTTINIPDSVTSIGDSAFFYCTNLTDINIPDSVTSIGSRAFYRCTSLTHIFVPSTVTTISAASYSDSPFYQCSSSLVIYTGVANASSVPSGWGTYWYYYEDGKILTVKYGYSRAQYEAEVGISNTSDQSQQALANLISRRNEMKNAIVIEVMIALVIVSAGVVINLATKKKKNEK